LGDAYPSGPVDALPFQPGASQKTPRMTEGTRIQVTELERKA
jgi:hypothetical protein